MQLYPYQSKGVADVLAAIADGKRKIILTSPTGGGKSLMIGTLVKHYYDRGERAIIYVNKKILTSQLETDLTEMGIPFGVRAAGHEQKLFAKVQLASMQTEHARQKAGKWELHEAKIVIVEEAHVQMGKTAWAILDKHLESGAAVVGVTATPLDMGEYYDHLIVAGTNSELRACGRLVAATHYGCDEPDLKALKVKESEGENLSESQMRKAIMTPTIFARVGEWYARLNPERKPAILFGPGLKESLWFAEQFHRRGISSAHIDGDDVWINGEFLQSDRDARQRVADGSRSGEIKVVCNRFVLREGVNWPWIEHLILAYVAGSLQTYLQIGGRGLRASPSTGKTGVIIQDHGGAWWRHGSLNADRHWDLRYTNATVAGIRADRMRKKVEREPWLCPECGQVINPIRDACTCGRPKPKKQSRKVVMADGSLREMTGDIFRPRRVMQQSNGPELWKKMYFRSCTEKGSRTFRAAMALFAQENNCQWPDPDWPFMPIHELDRYRLVKDVPRERLR